MSLQQTGLLVLAGLLVFWCVGAYNRLVRLRSDVGRAFAAVATQLLLRDGLLRQWAEAMEAFLEQTLNPNGDFLSACEQLRHAVERASPRPHVAGLIGELRSTDEALAGARTRLAAELPVHAHHISAVAAGLGASVMQVNEELSACDTALAFAREQFNARVHCYNHALVQFPTVLMTGAFGFRAAGAL